jgi:thioredoxin reductase (NADPH)
MEQALSLIKEESGFSLNMAGGAVLKAPCVILATGARHRMLDIPGEDKFSGRGVSYCATCDGPFFKNKKIFVAGGGDAACSEAQYLSRLSSNVILIHRRDRFRAQKSLAERVLTNPAIEVRFNTIMKEIRGQEKVASVVLESTERNQYEDTADAVFVFAGVIPQSSLVEDAAKDEAGYVLTDQHMASSVPGLFAAGDVRASPFRQVVVAAAEGAIAAHSAAAYLDEIKGRAY